MRIESINHYNRFLVHQAEQLAVYQEQIGQTQGAQDTVIISAQERRQLAKEALQKQIQNSEFEKDQLKRQLASANAQAEAMGESADTEIKCLKIALRIMSGDEVPREDHRYLAKNNPELYNKAIMLRIERENPKRHKRISEDDSDENDRAIDSSENEERELLVEDGGSDYPATAVSLDAKA